MVVVVVVVVVDAGAGKERKGMRLNALTICILKIDCSHRRSVTRGHVVAIKGP